MADRSPTVFLSYAREDSEFAEEIEQHLRAAGAAVWRDTVDIRPGERWDQAIQNAIDKSEFVVVLLSPSAVNSNNVLDEVGLAMDQQKEVIPLLYRDCRVPLRLSRVQSINVQTDPKTGVRKLLNSIGLTLPAKSIALPARVKPSPPKAPVGSLAYDYDHRAHAVGLAASIRQPRAFVLPGQALTVLPRFGGYVEIRASAYSSEVASFESAITRLVSQDLEAGAVGILCESVIEHLTIIERLTVDRLVTSLRMTHRPDDNPQISPVGSYVEGLKLDGRPIQVTFHNAFEIIDTHDKLEEAWHKDTHFRKLLTGLSLRDPSASGRNQKLGAPVRSSLVSEIQVSHPDMQVSGSELIIKDLGRIELFRIDLQSDFRTLCALSARLAGRLDGIVEAGFAEVGGAFR